MTTTAVSKSTVRVEAPAGPREPVAQEPPPAKRAQRPGRLSISRPFVYLLLVTYFLIVVYPMFWLFYSSLKSDRDIFLKPFALPNPSEVDAKTGEALGARALHFENYSSAWTKGHFREYFANSVILTTTTVLVTTLLAAMTGYAVARFSFRGSRAVYFYFLAGLMIPLQLAIVPLFFQMKNFGMLDTRWGLFVVYLAFGFPFSVFVLTGFFKSLPGSLHESAVLDGASEWQAFWHIMLPLARPGLITVAIFLFLGNWNEFFVAFMTLSGGRPAPDASAFQKFVADPRTLPLGIANITIVSNYRSDWGMAFAGLVLMMLPTLIAYILLQKHLTKGITAGAVKG